jgi:hypothetical protein
MMEGLAEGTTQLSLSGELQQLAGNVVGGEYSGYFDGQQAKARCVGTFSPHGGGAYIIAASTPEAYTTELASAADAISANMEYVKADMSQLIQVFSGTWAHTTGATLTNYTLYPDGTFESSYEAGYSGELSDGWSAPSGASDWGVAGQETNRGRWAARGTPESGTITMTWPDGTQHTVSYRVFVENGQTYWSEYLFDGDHYRKIR